MEHHVSEHAVTRWPKVLQQTWDPFRHMGGVGMVLQIEHDLDLPAFGDVRQAEEYAVSLVKVFR